MRGTRCMCQSWGDGILSIRVGERGMLLVHRTLGSIRNSAQSALSALWRSLGDDTSRKIPRISLSLSH